MSTSARLFITAGLEVQVDEVYGVPVYGKIGYGIGVTPGFPLFAGNEFIEIEEKVDPILGELYGVPAYGTITMRQAVRPGPVQGFRLEPDAVYSSEFVEWGTLEPQLRIGEDETEVYELTEVGWQD